jgi:hypothetical protein
MHYAALKGFFSVTNNWQTDEAAAKLRYSYTSRMLALYVMLLEDTALTY